jgi:arabinose-5-phosphate isomerase
MNKEEIINEAHRVFQEESDALSRLKIQNSDNIFEAVKLIIESNKVICSGVGKSGLIAQKIAATFSSLGIPALFLHPIEALHGDIGIVQDNDISILLSKSGSTDELLQLFPFLKSRTKIISITSNKNSFLANNSDVWLDARIEKEACAINLAPTTSTTMALAIGDALAACLVKAKKFSKEDFSKNHPLGQLGRNLTLRVKDVMHSGNDLPIVNIDDDFKFAIIEITNKNLGASLVYEKNQLVGIITDGDVRRALMTYNSIAGLKAKDVMTQKPIFTNVDTLLGDALSQMEDRKSQISILPVLDENGSCIGLLRIHDILKSSN